MSDRYYSDITHALYEASGLTHIPLDLWVDTIGAELPEFASGKESFYAPIPIIIKTTGTTNCPDGTVQIALQVKDDPNWYDKLKGAVAEMLGPRTKPVDFELCTYLGDCVRDFSHSQLIHAGELDAVLVQNNCKIRTPALPSIPLQYSTTKTEHLRNWFEDQVRDELASVIADHLEGKSPEEINGYVTNGGQLQGAIKDVLEQKAAQNNWPQFVRTFAESDRYHDKDPQEVAMEASQAVLEGVREAVTAHEPQIHAFYADRIMKKTGQAPVLKKHATTAIASRFHSDRDFYHHMMEDVLYGPKVARQVINAINKPGSYGAGYHHKPYVMRSSAPAPTGAGAGAGILQQFYKGPYYAMYQKIPGHAIADMRSAHAGKGNVGNPARAMRFFHLYSGRPQYPVVGMPNLIHVDDLELPPAIACHDADKKKKKKVEEDVEAGMPQFVPVERRAGKKKKKKTYRRAGDEMPPLVPVQGHAKDEKKKNKKEYVGGDMPPLVRVEGHAKGKKKEKKKEEEYDDDDEEAIMAKLPPLIKVGQSSSSSSSSNLMPIRMPVVPIRRYPVAAATEVINPADGLPDMPDFF